MKVYLKIFLFVIFIYSNSIAQIENSYEYDFEDPLILISSKQYNIYGLNKDGIKTIPNRLIIKSKDIKSFHLSPLGNEIIAVTDKKINKYSLGRVMEEELSEKFKYKIEIKKIISDKYGKNYFILLYDGKVLSIDSNLIIKEINLNERVLDISWSDNLESIFILTKSSIKRIVNEKVVSEKNIESNANSIFPLNELFTVVVGYKDGSISIITQDLKQDLKKLKVSKYAISSIINHPEDPHLFIGNTNGEIYMYNLLSNKLKFYKKVHNGKINLRSIKSSTGKKENEYLLSHGIDSKIKVWNIKKFEPDYKKYTDKKLENLKNQFYKIKENELESEFLKRTSSERSSKYFDMIRQNIIDSIAQTKKIETTLIEEKNDSIRITIKPFKSISVLNKDNLYTSFLKLTNVNFKINKLNSFDIKNFTLLDQSNGKNISYNPILDKKLELARKEEEKKNAIIAQKISRQELSLKNELTKLVSNLQMEGKINEVDLSVDSKLVKEKDSTGTDELNLKIAFLSRGVKAEAGANTSDYGPGKYNLFDSPSAKTLIQFFLKSTEAKLYQYLENGNRVTFRITGSTDKSKVNSTLPYEDEYGSFKNFPYFYQGSLEGMTLNKEKGINSNSQLGFLRTIAVKNFIEKNTDLFDLTRNKFILYSEESDQLGPQYRKVKIEMTIHNINKLMSLEQTSNKVLSDVDIEIPSSNNKIEGYALVIGNEDYASYQSELSTNQNVPFANRDAESFKNYLQKMYNMPSENIELVIDGTLAEMRDKISKFKKLIEINNELDLGNQFVFYYSGHGMPSETSNDPFIMPVDVSGYTVDEAISLNKLLKDFGGEGNTKVTLVIDACFSGASRSPEPLIKVKGVGSKKLRDRVKKKTSSKSYFNYYLPVSSVNVEYINPNIGKNMLLISSSSGEETSLTYDDKQHGLFTYFLLKFLKSSKGEILIKDLFNKLKKEVSIQSIMKFNKRQTPEVLYGEKINFENDLFLNND